MTEMGAMSILWIFLYGYVIVASVDFGAGVYFTYEKLADQQPVFQSLVRRYVSPFWEIINIGVIFLFTGLVSFFPEMTYYYGSALFTPGLIVFGLVILRGIIYVLYQYRIRDRAIYSLVFSFAGLFIPVLLTMALTMSEGGYIIVKHGSVHISLSHYLTSYYFWAVAGLAIVSILYISAMFFIYLAHRAEQQQALLKMRGFALFWSVPTVIMSGLVFAGLEAHNPEHFNKMLNMSWMFLLSLICFFIAVSLIFINRYYGLAFFFVLLQFLFAFFGYGLSHLPYILYPFIKLPEVIQLEQINDLFLFILSMVCAILITFAVLAVRIYTVIKKPSEYDEYH